MTDHRADTERADTERADTGGRVASGTVFRWAAAGALGVLVVAFAAYGIYLVRTILTLVLIALFVAISLEPPVRALVRRGMSRPAAVGLVMTVLIVLVGAFVWSVVPPIAEQTGRLLDDLPGLLNRLSEQYRPIQEIADRYNLTDRLSALAAGLPGWLAGGAVGFFQRFAGAVTSAFTVLVLAIYFMADLPRLRRGLLALFPPHRRDRVGAIVDVVVEKVGGYMIGNLTISLFAGVSSFACLEALRVPFALPLAVTVAVADLIPMIGATLGAAVCVLVTVFTVGVWPQAVVVLIFFVVYQQIENYLLVPRVYRNTVNMPSAAVLLVALTGGTLLGLAGAIMAIPIAATIKVALAPILPGEPTQDQSESI
jgi:predicted PurR-regulated permease PerM